jgi:hypothetical protein
MSPPQRANDKVFEYRPAAYEDAVRVGLHPARQRAS